MKRLKIYRKVVISCICITLLFSCKSAKNALASGKASSKVSVTQVIKQHQKKDTKFKTLQAKLRVDMIQNQKERGLSFSLRMEKDKVIWLSAPLGMARLMITPDKVSFYSKLDKTYFDGNYDLLSRVAGIDLDFNKVQNILLGQALFDLNAQQHSIEVSDNTYVLNPKDQDELLEIFYKVNPAHFKMDSQQLYQQQKQRFLQIDYSSYQNIDREVIPEKIKIIAVQKTKEVIVNLEFKSVSINNELRFPFRIPSSYKAMTID